MRWQPPEGGLSDAVRAAFFKRVTIVGPADAEHWLWTGVVVNGGRSGVLQVNTRQVPATRVAWAIVNPGDVPGRLNRDRVNCPHELCVHPRCWAPRGMTVVSAWQVPLDMATHDAGGRNAPNQLGGVPVPPLLAAMAHEQFGTDVVPVSRRFRSMADVEARLAEIDGTDSLMMTKQEVLVRGHDQHGAAAEEVQTHVLTRGQADFARRSAELEYDDLEGFRLRAHSADEVLARLMLPGTAVVTFKGGGVWIFGPRGERVNEDGPEAALRKFMVLSRAGRTEVV